MSDQKIIDHIRALVDLKQTASGYDLKCPYCQTSGEQLTSKKLKGHIYSRCGQYFYNCFSCNPNQSLIKLVKTIDPTYSSLSFTRKRVNAEKIISENYLKNMIVKSDKIKSRYTPISELPDDHKAKSYLVNRMVDVPLLADFYYIPNVFNLLMMYESYSKTRKDGTGDIFKTDAICFPFYLQDGSYSHIQFRFFDIIPKLKYITHCIEPETSNHKIWGLKYLNPKSHIFIAEGTIDAMMFDNCVSSGGHSSIISSAEWIMNTHSVAKGNITLIYDRDYMTNKDVRQQLNKAISLGFRVFLYSNEFSKIKDLNDVIMGGVMTKDQLKSFIYKNSVSGLKAKLLMSRLKEV